MLLTPAADVEGAPAPATIPQRRDSSLSDYVALCHRVLMQYGCSRQLGALLPRQQHSSNWCRLRGKAETMTTGINKQWQAGSTPWKDPSDPQSNSAGSRVCNHGAAVALCNTCSVVNLLFASALFEASGPSSITVQLQLHSAVCAAAVPRQPVSLSCIPASNQGL